MLKRSLFLTLLLSSSLCVAKTLRSKIPINAVIDINDIIFTGDISYDLTLNVRKQGNTYESIEIDFEQNLEKTSKRYIRKLKGFFQEYLSYNQLHSEEGMNSKQEIKNVEADGFGKKFLRLAVGKKAIEIKPLEADFSQSKTLNLVFHNIRNKFGKRVKKAEANLILKEKQNSFDIFYQNPLKKNSQPILVKDIQLKIVITALYKAKVSLSANNESIEILK